MSQAQATVFTGLVDLASASLGGRVLASNDDFFAGKENLVKVAPAVFLPDEYTERGKWMDGWESRRRREPGHDWAIIELGAAGIVRALDIDTAHFLGNHPPYASVEATVAEPGTDLETLEAAPWTEILPQMPLRPGSHNFFALGSEHVWTHLRLRIFPDGGVARLRVYGLVDPSRARSQADEPTMELLHAGEADLAAVARGAMAMACSDMFFGNMNNLISPGRAPNMGDGWETRRRRGPGHDWIVVRLAARGRVGLVEVDTNHFKGNCPASCVLEAIDDASARLTELVDLARDWQPVLPQTPLTPHTRHFLRDEVVERGPFTHVRLSIFPDGGVSRLRVWGPAA